MREEWRTVAIGEIAEVRGGSTPSTKNPSFWNGTHPWITPSEVTRAEGSTITKTDRQLTDEGLRKAGGYVPAGSVLLTSRATVGATAIAGVPLAVNQGFAALVPGPDVLSEYLMYWCQANRFEFESRAGGSTYPEISKPVVRDIELHLPPLAEQKRIVDLIEAIDFELSALRCSMAKCDESLFPLFDAEVDRIASEEAGLHEMVLGDLGVWKSGSTPKATESRFYGGETLFAAIGDLNDGEVVTTERTLTEAGAAEIGSLAPVGSVFVSMYGTIGRTGIAAKRMATNQAITWLEPNLDLVSPRFVQLWIRRHSGELDALGRGATQRNINRAIVKSLPVRLPSPHGQAEVVSAIDAVDVLRAALNDEMCALEEVRRIVLAELLSGEHEIPESYDRLLERVA